MWRGERERGEERGTDRELQVTTLEVSSTAGVEVLDTSLDRKHSRNQVEVVRYPSSLSSS